MAPLLMLSVFLGLLVQIHGSRVPGAPCDVSADDRRVQQVALSAAISFNNQSNDSFLFKPKRITRAQRQVVRGLLFSLDLVLCRSVCRKQEEKHLKECDEQPAGKLHQEVQCHVEQWEEPWSHRSVTQRFCCLGQSEGRVCLR
ncbi:unnamed protein product [Knipowitschia caucasica]|uniref:Cystatin domain-containing protein n=1 Tax=Knipowitschia caucasica TaxID=637954 RepID=A0AAV2JLE0_KNICA